MTPAKGFAEMKDSGIEWIGEIPAHWGILRGKNVLRLLERPVEPDDDVITCFRDGEVTLRKNRREEGFTNSLKEIGYQGIESGDLIVHGMDGFAGSIGISDSRGKASPVLNVMDSCQNKRYLMYYLRAMAYKDVFMALSTGIRVRSCDLRWNKLSVFPFLIPTNHEQSAIASYLDAQCARIDEIIAQAKASIEDYKQWKASIIYEAVTKGLDPNVEMKDSGIEWIGEIPAHWNITRMKSILKNITVKNHPYAEVLSLYRDYGVLPKNSRDDNHNVTSEDTTQYKYVEVGDLVINKMKAWQGSLAVSGYEGIVSPAYYVCKFRSEEVDKNYIHFLLRCSAYAQEFERLSTGMRIGQWDLGISDFMRVPTLLPPLSEQSAIAPYLDTQCAKIDKLISEKQSLIDDLESYKKSLIYEVVTGKRSVRQ